MLRSSAVFARLIVRLTLAVATLAALPAGAATIIYQQAVGGYDQGGATIRQDNPNLVQSTTATYTPGQIVGGNDLRAVFSFPLTSLNPGITITGVQLNLGTSADATSADATFTLQLYQLTSTFAEAAVSWNARDLTNNWGTPGGDFSATLLSQTTANPTATNSLVFASSPAFVSAAQGAVDAGLPLYFILKLDSVGESGTVRRIFSVNSDDAASAAARPALTVTFVPEPTTAILFAGGLVCLGLRRRR